MSDATPAPLSPDGRVRALSAVRDRTFDLLVVGGGITGAGVARHAALQGLSVALLEKSDFGAGTSSRSSKIIHGGVRYLEQLELGLVRESARERTALRRLAPHLVHPLPFLYPVFRGESLLKIRAGLLLFDLLAGSRGSERSRHLSPDETRTWLPGLRDPLKGSVLYPEYLTDDARFTLANVESAAQLGAVALNHVEVVSFSEARGRVRGARALDRETGSEFEIRAEVTVNATGPWAEPVLERSGLQVAEPITPSKGIHILIPRERLPLEAATFLRSSSDRRGLAMPRGPWVYIGTSDTEYRGDLNRPRALPEEIDELIAMTADCFPDAGIGPEDVVSTWAGIRPLIHEEGKSTRDMSRHDEVWIGPPGLVTVAGGKLTTYRPMAGRIMKRVAEDRGRALPDLPDGPEPLLPGAPKRPLEEFRSEVETRLHAHGVHKDIRTRLSTLYGTELDWLLERAESDPSLLEPLHAGSTALQGELHLAIRQGARTLVDALDRRMALLLFSRDRGEGAARSAARILGDALGWDPARRRTELEGYLREVREHGPRGVEGS